MGAPTAAVDRVDATSANRDMIEAIDRLQAAAAPDDFELARLQLRLRAAAFDRLADGNPPAAWPPALADPFPDVTGIPELAANALTSEAVGGAIVNHGSVIVRGLVPPDVMSELLDGIEQSFVAIDKWMDAGRTDDTTSPYFTPFEPPRRRKPIMRDWTREAGGVLGVDSPLVASRIFGLYHAIGLRSVLAGFFGDTPSISLEKLTLRKVGPETSPSWHQDGSFMGAGVRSVNLWLALTDCGGDAAVPGLEIVPKRIGELLATGTDGAMFPHSIGHGLVERVAGTIVRPAFRAGDALLFDDRLVHRSAVSEGMTGHRYAVESWFFSASRFPEGYHGLVF